MSSTNTIVRHAPYRGHRCEGSRRGVLHHGARRDRCACVRMQYGRRCTSRGMVRRCIRSGVRSVRGLFLTSRPPGTLWGPDRHSWDGSSFIQWLSGWFPGGSVATLRCERVVDNSGRVHHVRAKDPLRALDFAFWTSSIHRMMWTCRRVRLPSRGALLEAGLVEDLGSLGPPHGPHGGAGEGMGRPCPPVMVKS